MAHCESAYSDERKRVGEVAEQYLKQFEKSLDHKHAFACRHDLCFLFQNMGKRLLEEHDEQRNPKHDD